MTEFRYVNDPFEDEEEDNQFKRPKWMYPKEDSLEEDILSAVGRKYYPNRTLRTRIKYMAEAATPLSETESIYPTEWIVYCCNWARGKRKKGEFVNLLGLLNFIDREEAREDFVRSYKPPNEYDR